MDQIFAPWRMPYILGSKEDGCFLCKMFQEEDDRENLIVRRCEHIAIVLNRYPYNNAHLMVCPYRHVASIEELSPDEMTAMMSEAARCTGLMRQSMKAEGFNIGINMGAAAGAGLKDHLHLHIVPRWNGDTNFMPVIGQTKILPQTLDESRQALFKLFNNGEAS